MAKEKLHHQMTQEEREKEHDAYIEGQEPIVRDEAAPAPTEPSPTPRNKK